MKSFLKIGGVLLLLYALYSVFNAVTEAPSSFEPNYTENFISGTKGVIQAKHGVETVNLWSDHGSDRDLLGSAQAGDEIEIYKEAIYLDGTKYYRVYTSEVNGWCLADWIMIEND